MAAHRDRFRFQIKAFSPESMPMYHLAEYLVDLAKLLGSQERVHFVALEGGSTGVLMDVVKEETPKVTQRLKQIETGDAPENALKAFKAVNDRLAADNGSGTLFGPNGEKCIVMPGATNSERAKQTIFGPFNKDGSVEGVLIRIGGEGQKVPVHLEEEPGLIHICHAERKVARDLAQSFDRPLRVHGKGRWHRNEDGRWEMKNFIIETFDLLESQTLSEAIESLREIESPLRDMEDPLSELENLRSGSS